MPMGEDLRRKEKRRGQEPFFSFPLFLWFQKNPDQNIINIAKSRQFSDELNGSLDQRL